MARPMSWAAAARAATERNHRRLLWPAAPRARGATARRARARASRFLARLSRLGTRRAAPFASVRRGRWARAERQIHDLLGSYPSSDRRGLCARKPARDGPHVARPVPRLPRRAYRRLFRDDAAYGGEP